MDLPLILMSSLCLLFLIVLVFQRVTIQELKQTNEFLLKESNNSKIEKQKSLELTEFLQDFKEYGYSFVRVDPNSVFVRNSKGL